MTESSPFGSRSRTRILLALSGLEFSYPRALARRLDSPIFAVRKALARLERDGLVSSRLVGRTRVYRLDPAYVAYKELAAYLARLERARVESGGVAEAGAAGTGVEARADGLPPGRVRSVEADGAASRTAGREGPGPAKPDAGDGWRNW